MIQIVFVKWGTLYSTAHINNFAREIASNTNAQLKFVCITDDGKGLDDHIRVAPFPDMGVTFDQLTQRTCFGKLSIFDAGTLDPDLKTLYFDLDTAVMGDVQKLADVLDKHPVLHFLSNHFLQHWKFRKTVRRFDPDAYYFGNSSVIAFYPRDYHYLADQFRSMSEQVTARNADKTGHHSGLWSDERFISYYARDTLRVFHPALAARFQDTYMAPWLWLAALQDKLPWVRARRAQRVALTFSGEDNKPKRLAVIQPGDLVVAGGLKVRWQYPELQEYWARQAEYMPD